MVSMVQNKKRRINDDLDELILLILYKDGPQSIEQLEEKTALQTIRSINFDNRIRQRHRRHRRDDKPLRV